MDFDLTGDGRMLADTLARLLSDRYGFGERNRGAAFEDCFSREVWSQLAGLGAIGALFGEVAGGYGGVTVVHPEAGSTPPSRATPASTRLRRPARSSLPGCCSSAP
nr:hypothetical protein [uncultured Lichenicoccus sp.]